MRSTVPPSVRPVGIPAGAALLEGDLALPGAGAGVVVFAHGSGSGRHSARNRFVAETLRHAGLGTLLMDLLTPKEDRLDRVTRAHRFDIPLLSERLEAAGRWVEAELPGARLGLFGASTGAAAALRAAVALGPLVGAVVSRGGRPDLAGDALPRVQAPTLLLVGGWDPEVERLNHQAYGELSCEKALEIVPKASHLFEEPGALEAVAARAAQWFREWLGGPEKDWNRE